MRRTCLFLSSNFPPPLIGGSLVFYHYLLSQRSDRDVVGVDAARNPRAKAFDESVSYGVRRSRVVRDGAEPRRGRVAWFLLLTPWLLVEIVRGRVPVMHVGDWTMVVPAWIACRLLEKETGHHRPWRGTDDGLGRRAPDPVQARVGGSTTAWPVGHCGARTWSTRTAISRRSCCSTEVSGATASA